MEKCSVLVHSTSGFSKLLGMHMEPNSTVINIDSGKDDVRAEKNSETKNISVSFK